jgi:hypothetical protein
MKIQSGHAARKGLLLSPLLTVNPILLHLHSAIVHSRRYFRRVKAPPKTASQPHLSTAIRTIRCHLPTVNSRPDVSHNERHVANRPRAAQWPPRCADCNQVGLEAEPVALPCGVVAGRYVDRSQLRRTQLPPAPHSVCQGVWLLSMGSRRYVRR